jgi:hypothetical protein
VLSNASTTFGRLVAAPRGTFALTLRRRAAVGFTCSLPPSAALNSTLRTSLRWRPESSTVESAVAMCMPAQVSTQTASVSSGGSVAATPPPAADAIPAPMERQAIVTAAGAAVAVRRRFRGACVRALKISPCRAYGVSCRARAEERRYELVCSIRPRDGFRHRPFGSPAPARHGRAGFGRSIGRAEYSPRPGRPCDRWYGARRSTVSTIISGPRPFPRGRLFAAAQGARKRR